MLYSCKFSKEGKLFMQHFIFTPNKLSGLVQITPLTVNDQRGCLTKVFETNIFAAHGITFTLAEELESSSKKGTLRGLHFQQPHSQDKLVRVLYGKVYDVALDIRPNSPTFGMWQGFYLSAENQQMLYIPKGFAHGFYVCSEQSVLHYLCGDQYDPDSESGILWNDPELAIQWPLEKNAAPIVSPRDQSFQSFADFRCSIGRAVQ